LIPYLLNTTRDLLGFSSGREALLRLLARLYPQEAFPKIQPDSLLGANIVEDFLDALCQVPGKSKPVQAILRKCFRMATAHLLCGELCRDVRCLNGSGPGSDVEAAVLRIVKSLAPDQKAPTLLIFNDGSLPQGSISSSIVNSAKALEKNVRLVHVDDLSWLPLITRKYYQLWSVPLVDTSPAAVVFSRFPTAVLGALMCGFTAASVPSLPVYGSQAVESYLCQDLKDIFGAAYLPFHPDEVFAGIMAHCRSHR
jgi:hypothetical protein